MYFGYCFVTSSCMIIIALRLSENSVPHITIACGTHFHYYKTGQSTFSLVIDNCKVNNLGLLQ